MRLKLFLLSLLSALLLTAAWPDWGQTPLLFVAFIPLLWVQHIVSNDNRLRARHLFMYAYITFLIWNIACTWWVWYASPEGAMMAFLANALLMAFVFLIYHKVKRILPERFSTFSFIFIWISFEFLHLDWDLSWPWLTLGNAFGANPNWIQWYEYTGVFGGSAWVLLVNVLLFELIIHRNTLLRPVKLRSIYIGTVCLILLLPILFSFLIYSNFDLQANNCKPIDVVVVQPNIDPYEKFNGHFDEQLDKMVLLAASKTDAATDYVVLPETAIPRTMEEYDLRHSPSIIRFAQFSDSFPKLQFITGATTIKTYASGQKPSSTARTDKQSGIKYDVCNSAIVLNASRNFPIYHKSKLVPGVEKMPFPWLLGFLEDYAINMGGSTGSLGMQSERTVFKSENGKVAPVICYESIYGEYVGEYIHNGADYIFIITNDGWWQNTPGYRQHLLYGRLRTIETRKSIARSANTGISCFINQLGEIEQPQAWWTESAIRQKMYSKTGQTFYTRHGDYIARAFLWISLGMIVYGAFRLIRKKQTS
jgi:apolipoprotein N-acyltransferase